MAVVDQTQDLNGQQLYRLLSLYKAPEFVKNASTETLCGAGGMPAHLYADQAHMHYPCHTNAAVWASAGFMFEKAASGEPVPPLYRERLYKSAEWFGIKPAIEELEKSIIKNAQHDETQLADEDFALVLKYPDGHVDRLYPMRNGHEVKAAAAYMNQHRLEFTFADRQRIASKVLEKAAQYGVELGESRDVLEKSAGTGTCAASDAAALIRLRIRAMGTTNPPLQAELEKLAQMVESKAGQVDLYGTMSKLANVIDQIDREHGFIRQYGGILNPPEDTLFCVTEKVAMALSQELVGNELTGNFYKKSELSNMRLDDVIGVLGQDFANAIAIAGARVDGEKLARIVPTLPLNEARKFDSLASLAGIAPFAEKSAAAPVQMLSADDWNQAAKQHQTGFEGSLWSV